MLVLKYTDTKYNIILKPHLDIKLLALASYQTETMYEHQFELYLNLIQFRRVDWMPK